MLVVLFLNMHATVSLLLLCVDSSKMIDAVSNKYINVCFIFIGQCCRCNRVTMHVTLPIIVHYARN